MAKPTGRQPDGGTGAFSGMDPSQIASNLEPIFQAGTRMLENWRAVNEELMEFGRTRLNRNLEAGRRVAQSTSLEQAIEAQAEFTRTAMKDYIAESNKLAELGTRALFGSFSVWQPASTSESHAEPAETDSPPRRAAAE